MSSPPIIKNEEDRERLFGGRGHTGLSNLGNTCFMNTVLQCISKSFDFTEFMLCASKTEPMRRRYRIELDRKGIEKTTSGYRLTGNDVENLQKKLVICMDKLLFAMYDMNNVVAPRTIHDCIQHLSIKMGRIEFVGHGQKDAEEFYGFLMEQLHQGLCHKVRFTITGKPKNIYDKMALQAKDSWKRYFESEYSNIIENFYGQEYSVLTCPKCGYESGTFQPMNRVHLPVPRDTRSSVSLDDCFQLYNKGETLDSENTWHCEGCKSDVMANKRLSIWEKPNFMVVHLKRFTSDGRKINTLVNFPFYNCNIEKYCVGYGRDGIKYDLYGIANHGGDTGGGHYYAYCLDYDGLWREYNDSAVMLRANSEDPESLNKLITNKAYMLFYKKRV